jgi:serine acetyltransferase
VGDAVADPVGVGVVVAHAVGVTVADGVAVGDDESLGDGVPDGVRDGVGSKHSVPALPVQSTAMLMAYAHMLGSDTVWFMRTAPSLEHEKRSVVERGVAPHAVPPV